MIRQESTHRAAQDDFRLPSVGPLRPGSSGSEAHDAIVEQRRTQFDSLFERERAEVSEYACEEGVPEVGVCLPEHAIVLG